MKTTVGIVTYERPAYLGRLLESIADGDATPAEIRIVDDSSDRSAHDVVRRWTGEFADTEIVYRHRENRGSMQSARNQIIDAAAGDVICFLDDDTVCPAEWLSRLQDAYDGDVAGVGGPALKCDDDLQVVPEIDRTPENRNRITDYGEVFDYSSRWVPPSRVDTDVFHGANMSFRTDVLREIGGFDTGYAGPAIFEEWDVMARLKQRDYRLVYEPDAFVYHVEATVGGSREETYDGNPSAYWYARNSMRFKKKNYGDVFWRSVLRTAVRSTGPVPPIRTRVSDFLLGQSSARYWLSGYKDGLLAESP